MLGIKKTRNQRCASKVVNIGSIKSNLLDIHDNAHQNSNKIHVRLLHLRSSGRISHSAILRGDDAVIALVTKIFPKFR
jgi:hypothetical protein